MNSISHLGYEPDFSMDNNTISIKSEEYTDAVEKMFARINFLVTMFEMHAYNDKTYAAEAIRIANSLKTWANTQNNLQSDYDFNDISTIVENSSHDYMTAISDTFANVRVLMSFLNKLARINRDAAAFAEDSIVDFENFLNDKKINHKIVENSENKPTRMPSEYNQYMKKFVPVIQNSYAVAGNYYDYRIPYYEAAQSWIAKNNA